MTSAAVVARVRVLLVEEDLEARAAHERALVSAGHDVATAATIDEAARSARERRPDLAFLACRLPDGSGIELLQWWRASARMAAVPVILLASLSMPTEIKAAARAGANAVVLEPCSGDMLTRYLERILQGTMTVPASGPYRMTPVSSVLPLDPSSDEDDRDDEGRATPGLHEHEGAFHARCEQCLRGSPPLGHDACAAERRASALGWSQRSDGWDCPVCIERYKSSPLESRRWRVTSTRPSDGPTGRDRPGEPS